MMSGLSYLNNQYQSNWRSKQEVRRLSGTKLSFELPKVDVFNLRKCETHDICIITKVLRQYKRQLRFLMIEKNPEVKSIIIINS